MKITHALAAVGLVAGSLAAQPGPREYKPKLPDAVPSLDKILMESFVTEPTTIPPGAAHIILKVTVKNVTNTGGAAGYTLNGLKVKILRTNPQPDVVELETTFGSIVPGATQSVSQKVN